MPDFEKKDEPTQKDGSPKVLQVEILPPRDDQEGYAQGEEQRRYGNPYNRRIWSYSTFNNPGCLTGSITFSLFLILLFQYGLLAGIGFFVFHIIGSVIIAIQASRSLMLGRPFSPMPARIINWIACYLLVTWLSKGIS